MDYRLGHGQYAGRPVTRTLCAGQGFGGKPNPPKRQEGANGKKAPAKKAKSLMPLADAASKLLPKENVDGSVQFNNPGVGDFQVLDSLVEVSVALHSPGLGLDRS